MMSSSYYKDKLEKYKGYLGKVSGVSGKTSSSNESLSSSAKFVENIVINGESIDKGALKEIQSVLDSVDDAISAVKGEINRKISEYTGLYQKALAEEEAAHKAAAEKAAREAEARTTTQV